MRSLRARGHSARCARPLPHRPGVVGFRCVRPNDLPARPEAGRGDVDVVPPGGLGTARVVAGGSTEHKRTGSAVLDTHGEITREPLEVLGAVDREPVTSAHDPEVPSGVGGDEGVEPRQLVRRAGKRERPVDCRACATEEGRAGALALAEAVGSHGVGGHHRVRQQEREPPLVLLFARVTAGDTTPEDRDQGTQGHPSATSSQWPCARSPPSVPPVKSPLKLSARALSNDRNRLVHWCILPVALRFRVRSAGKARIPVGTWGRR